MAKPLKVSRVIFLLASLSVLAVAAGFPPDRRQLAKSQRPFTALARVNAHGGIGCGVLIGPDLVLTCSHCVSDNQRKLYPEIEVELGVGFEMPLHKARVKEGILSTGANDHLESGTDWAIVRLDRPLGYYYGWLECKEVEPASWSRTPVELLGYCECPEEVRTEFGHMDKPYQCPGAIKDVGTHILFHDCSMWGGTSGAPLLVKMEEKYFVAGLNFAGVDVGGEHLKNGFRPKYTKGLANLAIPARNWEPALRPLLSLPSPGLRTLWVRNRSSQSIRVVVRYQSIFQDLPETPLLTREFEIPWQKRVRVLSPEDGCVNSEVDISLTDLQGRRVGPEAPIEEERDGVKRAFFKKRLGNSVDYTALLP